MIAATPLPPPTTTDFDNYVQYLDTACELGKIDKINVIEIIKHNKNKKI
jgi:hypothetical protein